MATGVAGIGGERSGGPEVPVSGGRWVRGLEGAEIDRAELGRMGPGIGEAECQVRAAGIEAGQEPVVGAGGRVQADDRAVIGSWARAVGEEGGAVGWGEQGHGRVRGTGFQRVNQNQTAAGAMLAANQEAAAAGRGGTVSTFL